MSRSIESGDVLGGRYKVVSLEEKTPAGDLVLEGRDQVLGRRVSVLLAGARNNEKLIENSRTVAAGPRLGALQILDLGQTDEDLAYLITSYVPAHELLDALLGKGTDPDAESLGGDIFGAEAEPPASGDYEHVGDDADAEAEDSEKTGPATTQWSDVDYEAFGEESSVHRTGSSARKKGSRETLFDRAASDAAGPTAAASAASARRAEGSRLAEDAEYPEESDGYYDASPGAEAYDDYYDEEYGDEEPGRRSGPGAGLWITGIVVVLLLAALVFFGFSRLGAMVASMSPGESSPSRGTASASASSSATPSATPSAAPKEARVAGVRRVVTGQNPDFMASQDGTLKLAADGNQSTAWSSFGFSNAAWAGQTQGVGLALELADATRLKGLDVSQTSGNGGKYTVYLADKPSIDGALGAGSGTFSGPTSHVDFSAEAQKKDAKYVIVYFTEAPRLSQPIAGYPYGLRINEISPKQ